MEQLLTILKEVNEDIDYENCTTLIDDKLLDSFSILSIVSEVEDFYEIEFSPADLIPDNFNSAKAILGLVNRKLSDK